MENKKTKTAINAHAGKREFMKTAIAGAGLAALGLNPFQESLAGGAYEYLPPGFRPDTIRNAEGKVDYMLIYAFERMYTGHGEDSSEIKEILLRKIGITNRQVFASTPLEQPAYWFAMHYFNFNFQIWDARGMIDTERTMKKFGVENKSPMYYWALGDKEYYLTWVDNDKLGTAEKTELYLTKAIVGSAGLKGRDGELRKALNSSDAKADILHDIDHGLKKASLTDKKIASWALYMYRRNGSNAKVLDDDGYYFIVDYNKRLLNKKRVIDLTNLSTYKIGKPKSGKDFPGYRV